MEELKSLFGEESLNFEQFSKKLGEAGETIKLANLKSGNYVDKAKYEKLETSVNEWQTKYSALEESTKGYGELQNTYDTLKADYDALIIKQDEADKMSVISKSNVHPDFSEFVYSKVNSMVNDSKDFKTCLNEYLGEHKQYLKASQHTFANLENGNGAVKSENQKINEQIRKMRG